MAVETSRRLRRRKGDEDQLNSVVATEVLAQLVAQRQIRYERDAVMLGERIGSGENANADAVATLTDQA
jgi:hypothetical protein